MLSYPPFLQRITLCIALVFLFSSLDGFCSVCLGCVCFFFFLQAVKMPAVTNDGFMNLSLVQVVPPLVISLLVGFFFWH